MSNPIQSQTRLQIRQSIGRHVGDIIVSEVTITKDTSSLWDTYALQQGGTDEYIGRQVMINVPQGSIVAKEKSFVSAFNATDKDCTMAPVFTANLTDGDTYEMWNVMTIEEVNDLINQAITSISAGALQLKQDDSNFTSQQIYEYDWLSNYKGLSKVEYVYNTVIDHLLHNCDTAWTAGASVTATADTSFKKEGTASAKLVVAAGAAAGAVLGYIDISTMDISDSDRVEFDMYSSIALSAGELDFVLDDTSAVVSPVESIDIPAMDAATWYRHSLTLANPHLDSAIISLGVVNTTDVGACTLYFDNIHAVKNGSKLYRELPNQDAYFWGIVKNGTDYLQLTERGLSVARFPTQIRLTGYQLPSLFSDDTTNSEIDPEFIIAYSVYMLLTAHAKSSRLDVTDRAGKAETWKDTMDRTRRNTRTNFDGNTKWMQ